MFNADETYNGFSYEGSRPATNVKGTAHLFRHIVTNALVIYIECDTDKKIFDMAFRTPAHDDTGVSHIIEHSVLSGSKKYTSQECFEHIIYHSVADDINAYTANERTNFHFSSRNLKDFDILFDLYMDGIFNPSFLKDVTIFLREGWHLEKPKGKKVEAQGVVFNEMKAHMLNRISLEYKQSLADVFPGTCYAYEAGGNIVDIPTLSYEDTCNYYHKYYHPSNSVLCLYGNLDIMKYLKQIDEEFFAGYKCRNYNFKNMEAKKFPKGEIKHWCKPINTPEFIGEEMNDVWLTYAADRFSLLDSIMIQLIICYTLNYNDHKVRYNMIVNKLCSEMYPVWGDAAPGSFYGICFENVPDSVGESIVNTYIKYAEIIRDEGIDYRNMKLLIKVFKRMFLRNYKEEKYVDTVVEKALRGDDPFDMSIEEVFAIIEDKLVNDLGWFSEYFDNYLIHAKAYSISVFQPDPTYKEWLLSELDNVINPKKEKWTREEIINIKKVSKLMAERPYYSEKPTVTHDILTSKDIDTSVEWNKSQKVSVLGKDVNAYVIPGSDRTFINFEFDISNLSVKETALFSIMADNLFYNNTRKRSQMDVSNRVDNFIEEHTSRIVYTNDNENDKLNRVLKISVEVLNENLEKALDILGELFVYSTYGHRVSTYSMVYWDAIEIAGLTCEKPANVAPMITNSLFSKAANMRNLTAGPQALNYLFNLLSDSSSSEGMKKLARKCQKIFLKVFNVSRMSLFMASSEEQIPNLARLLNKNLSDMPYNLSEEDAEYIPVTRGYQASNEAASIQSLVQYNALSIDMREEMKGFKGSPEVICDYIQEWIVHKLIREKGNAYGSQIRYADGIFTLTSYRDPAFEVTLDTFVSIGSYAKQLNPIDFERTKVAVAGRKNLFNSEIEKIEAIEAYAKRGKTAKDMKNDADIILNTTEEDLKYVCEKLEEAAKNNKYNYYSIGNIDAFKNSREGVLSRIIVY